LSFFREKHPKKRPVARHKAFTARCYSELLIRVFNASLIIDTSNALKFVVEFFRVGKLSEKKIAHRAIFN